MPPRKRPTPADAEQSHSPVDRLADQIGLLVLAMDEIREQLHWLATNGIPRCEPGRDEPPTTAPIPVAVVRDQATLVDSDSPEAEIIRQVVERLETGIASIATDQLALFVDALDDARDDLLAALKGETQETLDFQDSRDLAGTVVPRPVLPTGTTGSKAAADTQRSNHSPTDTTPCVHLSARSTITKARRMAEDNGWDWHEVLRMARHGGKTPVHS